MPPRDYFKAQHKKTLAEATRIPKAQETQDKYWKSKLTKYSTLSLGVGGDGKCALTQEERENHFHVIGTTGEGKSMLLLRMLMSDIDRIRSKEEGPGVCFIDGSENGDTMYKVLGYCEQVGFKRVLIVDPDSRFTHKKITPINPIHTAPSLITENIENLTQVFQYVFSVNDPARTAYIENYLPAFFRILSTAQLTLHDFKYFTDFDQWMMRENVFNLSKDEDSIKKLKLAYKNIPLFSKEVGSTMRRIDSAFRNEGLHQILTHRRGIDFTKLIADRWLILVNPSRMRKITGRLLSAIVINEIIFGLNRLIKNNWKGYEYLYIDEAARYATDQIADILDLFRKIGLRLILSHQHMGQFEDPALARTIKVNAKTKLAFYIADEEERMKVVRMLYGGKLSDREVSYTLSSQEKQNAVVKLGKAPPRVIRIHDTPVYKVSDAFLQEIYKSPWYYTTKEISDDTHERFSGQNYVRAERTATANRGANSKGNKRQAKHSSGTPEPSSKGETNSPPKNTELQNLWGDVLVSKDRAKE
jgi:hypothetical protein